MVLRVLLLTTLLATLPHAVAQPQSGSEVGSTGTGFAVSSEGHLVTNDHVVQECVSIRAVALDGNRHDVIVVARDARNDLALLKGSITSRSFASFRRNPIRSGDEVTALGFPYSGLLASDVNVSVGIVSAMAGLRNDTSTIQISAPVQPGNSGGPLLDSTGALAGVVVSKLNALAVAKATGGDIPQNVNFAIKGELVQSFLISNGVEPRFITDGRSRLPTTAVVQQARSHIYLIECLTRPKHTVATEGRNASPQQTSRPENADASRARPLNPQETKDALGRIAQEAQGACANPAFDIIRAKVGCKEEETTLDQLSDTSSITAAEKQAFMNSYKGSKARRKSMVAVLRSSGHPNRQALAEHAEKTEVLAEANALALYEGSITWGQYNKRRKEIALTFTDEMRRLSQSSGASQTSERRN